MNPTHPRFILASASPQRKKLIESLGIIPLVPVLDFQESPQLHLNPREMVQTLAEDKLQQFISAQNHSSDSWILTADTLVFLNDTPLGKPSNPGEANQFIQKLSGKTHRVITGVCLSVPDTSIRTFTVETLVDFKDLQPQQIQWYIDTNEWKGAAGGYRIQGAGAAFVEGIKGSSTNVIGLPLAEIYGILWEHKFWQ